ncbi:MAG: polyphosphate kinase 1 [Gammaproteobacteria bacterium]
MDDTAAPEGPDLRRPELYFNRELSQIELIRRVLEQAKDPAIPLLERLRFMCISCTSLDEFFEIRVGGLKERVELGSAYVRRDGLSATETLGAISSVAHELVDEQYRVFNEVLTPALARREVRFIPRGEWSEPQARWLHQLFQESVLPVLTPIGLDPAHPFPRIINKSLNFIVSLEGEDVFGRPAGLAVVQAPRSLPRVIRLPPEDPWNGPDDFVFLSSIIHAFVGELFAGLQVLGCYQFRVTRNSDLFVDDEEVEDLLRAVEGELAARRYGDEVRLEVARGCPEELVGFLLRRFGLGPDDLYEVNGPVNLNRLSAVADLVNRADLKYPAFTPSLPAELAHGQSIMAAMAAGDILLHHPYESFTPVVELVREAAADRDVLAIKQTLYRGAPDSPVVDALVSAARAGKEVTVAVELMARFDEEASIALANRLQEAGAQVVYGVVGFKTHANMLMVVRRESGRMVRYVHLGTGNYHPRTARRYTDYSLLTCDGQTGRDVHEAFMQLTSPGTPAELEKLCTAPFRLHDAMLERIGREAEHTAAGRPARIVAKMNALVEPEIIEALYAASRAGGEIDLVVRGICCLRPGIEGVSERIRVRSIIGRFVEHARVFYFHNGGEPEILCASGDWMERNFFTRVEVCFPVEDEALQRRLVDDLEVDLWDNCQAWMMQADGRYVRRDPGDDLAVSSQQVFLESLCAEVSGG